MNAETPDIRKTTRYFEINKLLNPQSVDIASERPYFVHFISDFLRDDEENGWMQYLLWRGVSKSTDPKTAEAYFNLLQHLKASRDK